MHVECGFARKQNDFYVDLEMVSVTPLEAEHRISAGIRDSLSHIYFFFLANFAEFSQRTIS